MLTENGLTFKKVILAVGKSDLRRGIDGLAAMVRLKYGLDPLQEDTLFLFCGVRRDRLKDYYGPETGSFFCISGWRTGVSNGRGQRKKPEALPRRNLKD